MGTGTAAVTIVGVILRMCFSKSFTTPVSLALGFIIVNVQSTKGPMNRETNKAVQTLVFTVNVITP